MQDFTWDEFAAISFMVLCGLLVVFIAMEAGDKLEKWWEGRR